MKKRYIKPNITIIRSGYEEALLAAVSSTPYADSKRGTFVMDEFESFEDEDEQN